MRLLFKFNLIFAIVLGGGIAATAFLSRESLNRAAREQVLEQARLMMETTSSTRVYTSKQIRPLIEHLQRRDREFYPQSVPAYSATQVFGYLRTAFPEYTYKEATLNPTNLADRAVDWEADVVNVFRNDAARTELSGERETPTGRSLYLAKPIKAIAACLECHSVPKVAPAPMVRIYGSNNGFGWKENEIIGAQVISVPESLPLRVADRQFRNMMFWFVAIGAAVMLVLNILLLFAVVRPVAAMSATADAISRGELGVPELEVRGKDEISALADSFNRMHRSLIKAMKLLDE
jgi:HAMP domain-containing protein